MSFSVKKIRDSFNKTRPISEDVSAKFYEMLFADHPEAEGLFHDVDIPKQQQLLYNSLDFITTNLDNPERLSGYLQSLGERHVAYGAKGEHYEWVGQALIKTFAHFFGDDWDQDLEQNWIAAFDTIAGYMKLGLTVEENKVVPLTQQASSSVSASSIEIPQQVRDEIRKQVQEAISEAIDATVADIVKQELDKLGQNDVDKAVKKIKGAA